MAGIDCSRQTHAVFTPLFTLFPGFQVFQLSPQFSEKRRPTANPPLNPQTPAFTYPPSRPFPRPSIQHRGRLARLPVSPVSLAMPAHSLSCCFPRELFVPFKLSRQHPKPPSTPSLPCIDRPRPSGKHSTPPYPHPPSPARAGRPASPQVPPKACNVPSLKPNPPSPTPPTHPTQDAPNPPNKQINPPPLLLSFLLRADVPPHLLLSLLPSHVQNPHKDPQRKVLFLSTPHLLIQTNKQPPTHPLFQPPPPNKQTATYPSPYFNPPSPPFPHARSFPTKTHSPPPPTQPSSAHR